ncbi:hypothetical protein ACQBAU_02385 [Propionibacteriaceae bacterium Y2011]
MSFTDAGPAVDNRSVGGLWTNASHDLPIRIVSGTFQPTPPPVTA